MKTLKANNRGRETARRDGPELGAAPGSANGWKRCSDEMPDSDTTVIVYQPVWEEPVWIAGVSDFWTGHHDIAGALADVTDSTAKNSA